MNRLSSTSTFTDDGRAVTPVIGVLLLFGFLILLLALYQAQIVPQQNAQVEFQHYQTVQNDLIELRNSIVTTGQVDMPQFTRVALGTTYKTRVATINPVAPAGTLRTSDPYTITVDNGTVSKNVSTRFLEYEPRYNEITASSIWYEHSVLYVDERDRGPVRILEDQNLITNHSNTLRLTALQNEFKETGRQRPIIELYPTENINNSELPSGQLNVTIPTRLNKSEYWGDQLGTEVDVVENYYDAGVHKLDLSNLNISSNKSKFNTVGIREKPAANQSKQNVGPSSGNNREFELIVDIVADTDDSTVSVSWDEGSDEFNRTEQGQYIIEEGTEVTLQANAVNPDQFVQWSGDVDSTNTTITIVIDSDTGITAEFAQGGGGGPPGGGGGPPGGGGGGPPGG